MHRLLPHPLLTPALALVWLLLNNSFAPGHILLGILLGWLLPLFTLSFWPDRVAIRRPWRLIGFFAMLLFDIVVANLNVARLILGSPKRLRPGFVRVPLDMESELGISLLANTITLTPGTLTALVSDDRRALIVHAMDLEDPQALVDGIKRRYEAPLKEVFEGC